MEIFYESIVSDGEVYSSPSQLEDIEEQLHNLSITTSENQFFLKTQHQTFPFEFHSSENCTTVFKCTTSTEFILKKTLVSKENVSDGNEVIGLDSEKAVLRNLKDNIVNTDCKSLLENRVGSH